MLPQADPGLASHAYPGLASHAYPGLASHASRVAEEIKRIVDVLDGPHGSLIVAATKIIMPDTTFENIVAMFRTMHDDGREKRRAPAPQSGD